MDHIESYLDALFLPQETMLARCMLQSCAGAFVRPSACLYVTHQYCMTSSLAISERPRTFCNNYMLFNHLFHYDLREHFFSVRIVNFWNSLLINSVVDAFKARLDKLWSHHTV